MSSLALLAILTAGCDPVCEGAGCADGYPAADIALFTGGPWAAERSPLEPDVSVPGREGDGWDWSLAGHQDALVVGVPAAGSVRRWDALAFELGAPATVVTGDATSRFGAAIGLDATGLLVGAPDASRGAGGDRAGTVYAWALDAAGAIAGAEAWTLTGEHAGDRLGEGAWRCGDLDGDGAPDWAAAAPRARAVVDDVEVSLAGKVYVGLSAVADWSGPLDPATLRARAGDATGARFGADVLCDADIDGDGLAELVVGAPYAADGRGRAELWQGGDAAFEGAADLVLEGDAAEAWLGGAIAAGDLDGDGLAELVVGAPGTDGPDADDIAGAVLLWRGDALVEAMRGGNSPSAALTLTGAHPRGGFGTTVHLADLDGDGTPDLIVGAPGTNPTNEDAAVQSGAVYVWWGPWTDWLPEADDADARIVAARQYLRSGERLDTLDIDADGAAELFLAVRSEGDGTP